MSQLRDLSWRPPYAYVPGQTKRHTDDIFDTIKNDAKGIDYRAFEQTSTFWYATAFLKEGFYWESHEVFEALWLRCPPESSEKKLIQALIQIANMHLKLKMGRSNASVRLKKIASQLWEEAFNGSSEPIYGVKPNDLSNLMHYNA